MNNSIEIRTFDSVWDAISDTPAEAVNLRLRSNLMEQIDTIVAERGWTRREAAAYCGVTQQRMSDLLRGRISRFSSDALVNIAAILGLPMNEGPEDTAARHDGIMPSPSGGPEHLHNLDSAAENRPDLKLGSSSARPQLPPDLAELWEAFGEDARSAILEALNNGDPEAGRRLLENVFFSPPQMTGLSPQKVRQRITALGRQLWPSSETHRPIENLHDDRDWQEEREQQTKGRAKGVDRLAALESVNRGLVAVEQCLRRGDEAQARNFLEGLVKNQDAQGLPDTDIHVAKTLSKAAVLARDAGWLEWAEELQREACRRNEPDPVAASGLADVLKAGGDLEAAERQYRDNIARWPNNEVAASGLAEVLKAGGDLEAAERQYRDNIARWPNNGVARHGLANVLRKRQRHAEALQLLPDPSKPVTDQDRYNLHLRGMILLELGRWENASDAFERGLQAAAPIHQAIFRRGLVLLELSRKDFDAALRGLQDLPEDVAELNIYRLHAAAGRKDETEARAIHARLSADDHMDPVTRTAFEEVETAYCLNSASGLCEPDQEASQAILDAEIEMAL